MTDIRQPADLQRSADLRTQQEKERLLRDWTAAGGTEADFEAAWPEIHTQLSQTRVMEIGARARARSLTALRRH